MTRVEHTGAVMGAIVSDIDLAAGTTAAELNRLLLEHRMLCLRGLTLDPHGFLAAGRLFGGPQVQLLSDYRLDDPEEVTVISNYNKLAGGKPHVRATHWHTDDSYFAVPAKATMLLARALPANGGGTEFINCAAVLDAMPDALRRRIEGRRAVHKYQSSRAKAIVAKRTAEEEAKTPDVSHPLIRTHPETGVPSLYINPNRIDHVDGIDRAESDALLDELYAFAFQPQFQHRHDWQLGDLVIWDNRCTMHRATTNFDVTELREFHRILLRGTTPE
jgi:taurine dioxygenase